MITLYTSEFGIKLLQEGYSAYAWNFPTKDSIGFLVNSKHVKLEHMQEIGDFVEKFFVVKSDSKISLINR